MPAQVMALLPAGLDMENLGVAGQTTQMMAADAAAEVDPLSDAARPASVLVVWEGTNDLMLRHRRRPYDVEAGLPPPAPRTARRGSAPAFAS